MSLLSVLAACGGSGTTGGTSNSTAEPQHAARSALVCHEVVLCIRGDHWDSTLCRCMPDEADAGTGADAAEDVAVEAGGEAGDDGGDASSCTGN